jgi:hypothetical protein
MADLNLWLLWAIGGFVVHTVIFHGNDMDDAIECQVGHRRDWDNFEFNIMVWIIPVCLGIYFLYCLNSALSSPEPDTAAMTQPVVKAAAPHAAAAHVAHKSTKAVVSHPVRHHQKAVAPKKHA